MSDLAPVSPSEVRVPPEQLQAIFKIYDDGLYLQAFRLAEQSGPLKNWRGTKARILAARMAGNLGSMRMADWHFIHAWRKDRQHPESLWFFARYLLARRGPLAAWKFVQSQQFPADAPKELRSHWLSQHAAILGPLRDFDAAEDWLRRAEEIGAEPWTCLEWAMLYTLQDRPEDAEKAARRALQLRPWYRPAVQWVAHFLVQKERDQEALALLTEATQKLESAAVYAQLANLQMELKRLDEAGHSFDEFQRHSPLLDKDQKKWLDARRCDLYCLRGDYDKALEHAKQVKGKFYEGLVERLSNRIAPLSSPRPVGQAFQPDSQAGKPDLHPGGLGVRGPRVELPVGFVQQHHKTCAPATLTSIAKFWTMPAEHVEVAEEIAYYGTPSHAERKWAQDHGWHTKSFTCTWDAAVALIDAGIPFTLATVDVSSAHLQAIVGYDTVRRTLIVRDPGERHKLELSFDLMLERYRSTGPRGMALIPLAQKAKLDAMTLPDEAMYEHLHRFDLALVAHRRAEADKEVRAMSALSPGHFLTLHARRFLAFYDADLPQELLCTEQLLTLFPGDLKLQLDRANYLSILGRRDERLEILKRLSEQKETDPACWQFYAQELAADARRDTETLYLLKKAMRATPPSAPLQGRLLDTLARIRWDQHRFDEAMQLHHFATCVDDKDEYLAQNYFMSALARGQTEKVLKFLQLRFQRFGAKSSLPARTLYWAYLQMDRRGEAFETLDEAMRLRPNDGELLTYAGEAHMHKGEFDKAEAILARAEGVSKPGARLRSLAYLAYNQDQRLKARDLWAEVIKLEPLAEDAHRTYALLLAEKEERAAAVKHLADVCGRFPNHFGLTRMWYDWLVEEGPTAREPILKKLIDIHPANVWARIEYAYNLADQDRIDEALRQLDEGERIDPAGPGIWFARGFLHKKRKRAEDAQHAFRETIRRAVDFEPGIHELLWQCETLQERRDAVSFIVGELLRQTSFGNGVLALAWAAQPNFPPDELLVSLRRIQNERPELWQAWTSVTRQYLYAERNTECLANAQKAVQRFPSLAALWTDLAEAQRVNQDADAELQSLQRAVELHPGSNVTVRMLAEAYEYAAENDKAKKVYEQAIRRAPLVPISYLDYAEHLSRRNDFEGAIKQARQALKIDPWLENAWNRVCTWYIQFGRFDDMLELARDWTKKLPGDMRSWFRLAQAHQWITPRGAADEEKKRIDDCTRAYDEALKRNPYARDIHDFKAEMLALAQRYDDARKACNPAAWKGKVPLELRGRAAWIKAQEGDFAAAKKQMAVLLKEDSYYQWGWNQLAEWSFASQEFNDYLSATGDMLRHRPQSALALAYRGEARIRMDEREAGIEDLRSAQRKDPCNAFAGYLLFDEQITDNNVAGAEATLLAIKQNLVGDFVRAREIQLAAKKESQESALALFKQMCEARFPQTQALDIAVRAFDQANWKEPADRILQAAMQKPHPQWHLHLAMLYASGWNPTLANDLPDRIAAIDRALERQPEAFVFLDLKANLLTSGNQFERAWQACQAKTFPQDEVALQGRAAWVMYRSGNGRDAIAKMKELVRDNPKYMWGWYQLAEWYGQQQAWVDCLTVAETLVQLSPRDPVGYGHRGWAKQNLGDVQAARADYVHAWDLAPTYIFAAWQLFDLHVRNQEWRKAEKILEKAQKHADKGEWALRKVDMLVYQNRKASFPAEFENLLRNASKNPWLIDQSLMFLVQAGWWSDAEEVLHKCLDLGAHICDPWVRLRVQMGDRSVGRDIQNMSERRPERTNCVAAYAVELAYSKDPHGLRTWINSEDDCLRADTPSWAKVGAALYVVQDWDGLCEWMSDWPDHAKATPGHLLPLVKALRSLDRVEAARKVSGHALTKLNPDYANSFHKVWLMYDQAMNGEVLPVQRYLESSDLGGFDGYHQMIAAMVRALWLTQTDKETGFSRARQVLADAATWAPPTIHDPALTKSYQACVAEQAALRGTFGAKLWRMWRWLFPKLPQVPKPPG